jgi:hypothetical protein
MAGKADAIRQELASLVGKGLDLGMGLGDDKGRANFRLEYHKWYTSALPVVRDLLPDRLAEFQRLHHLDRRKDITPETYTLEGWMNGLQVMRGLEEVFDRDAVAATKFSNQVLILQSAESRLTGALANIRGVLQADLFDSELDAARHLRDNGHLRAAGAVAGVVLESHLAEVCSQHAVQIRKKDPHISDYNDALKNAGLFDVVQWRGVQSLADIRNLCDHKKQRDPTRDEVDELISGVDKAIKTLA